MFSQLIDSVYQMHSDLWKATNPKKNELISMCAHSQHCKIELN